MYKKETQAIGRLMEKTMIAKYGPENIKEHFAAFDTICDATQVPRDDYIVALSRRPRPAPSPRVSVSPMAHIPARAYPPSPPPSIAGAAGCYLRDVGGVEEQTS